MSERFRGNREEICDALAVFLVNSMLGKIFWGFGAVGRLDGFFVSLCGLIVHKIREMCMRICLVVDVTNNEVRVKVLEPAGSCRWLLPNQFEIISLCTFTSRPIQF